MADQRFSALATDPRYRLPSRKQARTAVDPRFKTLFTDQDFRKQASVDRYGRKLKPGGGKAELRRLYRLEKEKDPKRTGEAAGKLDRPAVGSSAEDESEEESFSERLTQGKDRAREGGFSESSSDEGSTSDEESDAEAELAEETAGIEQTEDVPLGEVSHRLAAVNLDWDNVRASDVLAVASSFVPNNGRIIIVTVYPSEFGRERLQREELEGPPRDIFASSHRRQDSDGTGGESEEEDDDEKIRKNILQDQVNEGEEFDTAKLRQYQLERLRYYYAVISCDSKATAKALYDSMDGREYLTTSNFFDLRFIPQETSFDDDKPRDECARLPEGYKPNDFRTEALTHSKVRLTWDDDDTTRKEVQKRAFSRAEMDENDLQAYIGSDSSDAESVASHVSAAENRKAKKREAERQKMRAVLGLGAEPTRSPNKASDEPAGDMQITFSAGLSTNKGGNGVFENEPQDEESTRARYIRKERERKQKRKEKVKAAHDEESGSKPDSSTAKDDTVGGAEKDPFNDPFFADPAASAAAEKAAKKAEREKKRGAKAAEGEAAAARRAELELLMAQDKDDNMRHFDMKEIEKAQKHVKRKGKKREKKQMDLSEEADGDATADGFKVETEDPRFKALFESHEYAIDPSNPKFKGTEGMKALLEQGRKKRKHDNVDGAEKMGQRDGGRGKKTRAAVSSAVDDNEVSGLVARLKKGSKAR